MVTAGATTVLVRAHIAVSTGTHIIVGSSIIIVGAHTLMIATIRGIVAGTTIRRSAAGTCLIMPAVVAIAHSIAGTERHAVIGTHVIVSAIVPTTSVIAHINRGTAEVIITSAIVVEHGVIPSGTNPTHRAEEVFDGAIESVLPIKENATEISISVVPIMTVAIRSGSDAHQIIKVHLISPVILFRS